MSKDFMFDEHSFQDEITTMYEAKSCYDYFTGNLTRFRSELSKSGLDYEEIEKRVRQCWHNLIKSSYRVGYTNKHYDRIIQKYRKESSHNKG